jgi:hypothetical protein
LLVYKSIGNDDDPLAAHTRANTKVAIGKRRVAHKKTLKWHVIDPKDFLDGLAKKK